MGKHITGKLRKFAAFFLVFLLLLLTVLEIGLRFSVSKKPWVPDYPKEDISPVLYKKSYTNEDYRFLYLQTGLGRIGIDELVAAGEYEKIITIHHQFFDEQNLIFERFSIFAAILHRSDTITLHAPLSDGDILYSPSTYFSFFEVGHSALVTNGKKELMAQASGYGNPLETIDSRSFFARPIYVILRVNTDEESRNNAVKYTKDNCIGARYNILAGIFDSEPDGKLKSTHCSHFINLAYASVGIELDSDGGRIVTPKDIFNSPGLSVVQVFGIDPNSEMLFDRALSSSSE